MCRNFIETSYVMKLIFFIIFIFYSCKGPIKHEAFSELSDYPVYAKDVKSESIPNGRVEFIDSSIIREYNYDAFKNVFLLYYDSICIAVYNEHPKKNLLLIRKFISVYDTDTTKLASFVKFDDSIRITIDRVCEVRNNEDCFGKYSHWKTLYFNLMNKEYIKAKEIIFTQHRERSQ